MPPSSQMSYYGSSIICQIMCAMYNVQHRPQLSEAATKTAVTSTRPQSHARATALVTAATGPSISLPELYCTGRAGTVSYGWFVAVKEAPGLGLEWHSSPSVSQYNPAQISRTHA